MTKEAYFEKLSYALRRRELLPRPVEEDGLLPVEWNGRILCRVTERGAVRYDPTWVDTDRAKAALAQVAEAAGDGDGLHDASGGGPAAEGGGTGGTVTGYWQSSTARCWPGRRHCWGPSSSHGPGTMTGEESTTATTTWRITRAPRRTSPSVPVWWPGSGSFDREQLEELLQAVQGFLRGEGPASYQQEYQCRRLLEQINEQLPATEQNQIQREGHHLEQSM